MPIRPENRELYPADWPEIRARILERAQNRCEWCGVEHLSYRGTAKIVLTVAHLDHDPRNNADDNLAALCQRCHNRHDAEHRRQTRSHTRMLCPEQGELFAGGEG